jgi:hypothetical protein
MTRRLTSFQLGEVITGEPHLYVGNPPARPSGSVVEKHETSQPNDSHCFKRFVAAVRRRFRLGSTLEDTLTRPLGNAFRP